MKKIMFALFFALSATCFALESDCEKMIRFAKQQQLQYPNIALQKYFEALYNHPDAIELQYGQKIATSYPKAPIQAKKWSGEPLKGKHICVWMQKGLGDQLQFVRFATNLESMGAKVTLLCPKTLQLLFETSFPTMTIVTNAKELGDFDYHCPLLAIPHILQIMSSAIPYKEGYLSAARTKDFSFLFPKDKFSIGLVFSGDPNHPCNPERSIDPKQLAFLSSMNDVALYSLQYGAPKAILSSFRHITDLTSYIKTFNDTALLVQEMDLVIVVDTSVCHVAAGLKQGPKHVFLLLPKNADLRWPGEGSDNFWYTNLTLLRQKTKGDWSDPLQKIHSFVEAQCELKQRASK